MLFTITSAVGYSDNNLSQYSCLSCIDMALFMDALKKTEVWLFADMLACHTYCYISSISNKNTHPLASASTVRVHSDEQKRRKKTPFVEHTEGKRSLSICCTSLNRLFSCYAATHVLLKLLPLLANHHTFILKCGSHPAQRWSTNMQNVCFSKVVVLFCFVFTVDIIIDKCHFAPHHINLSSNISMNEISMTCACLLSFLWYHIIGCLVYVQDFRCSPWIWVMCTRVCWQLVMKYISMQSPLIWTSMKWKLETSSKTHVFIFCYRC